MDIRKVNLQANSKLTKLAKPKIKPEYEVDSAIFDKLRQLRIEIAKAEEMPAYIIFDNKTLTEMAYFLPDSKEKLLQINGVGQVKLEKYGERFLTLLTFLKHNDL